MEIKGKVHEISSVIEVSPTFKKRELVIEYSENPQYPEFIKLEATQERVSLLDTCNPGDIVEVFFNLRGRPWANPKTGKTDYFNTLNIWRIKNDVAPGTTEQSSNASHSAPANTTSFTAPSADISSDEDDDLPF